MGLPPPFFQMFDCSGERQEKAKYPSFGMIEAADLLVGGDGEIEPGHVIAAVGGAGGVLPEVGASAGTWW